MSRKRIYEIIEKAEGHDALSAAYDYSMIVIIIISLIPLAFKTDTIAFQVMDKATVIVFIIDYLLRWMTADYKYSKREASSFLRYPFSPMAVVDLINVMDDSTCSRLVAAYVLGYKVTGTNAHIRPAKDSADLGVTVCYNSVRDNSCAIPFLSAGNLMAINPVNWRTDATPAMLIDPRYGDTLTVTLDTTSLLLHIDGYTRNDYMLPLVGCDGNYHCLEISLFRDCLRRNIALRASRASAQ